MEDFFIPRFHSLKNGNKFTGSKGDFRFRVEPIVEKKPNKEIDFEASMIIAEYWHGPYCYDKSTMEGKKEFPLSEEGRTAMIEWLITHI